MKLSDFKFDLPEDLIATRPARPRSSARLLVAGPTAQVDAAVSDLPRYLLPGDRLILNDTKVVPARLAGQRRRASAQGPVSAKIEITLLEPQPAGTWRALIKPLKKVREGEVIEIAEGFSARLVAKEDGAAILAFSLGGDDFDAALEAAGNMPLPPYIAAKRAADAADKEDYQTLWARRSGAVAAPTASLHFDAPLMQAIAERGVETTHVTLHVGAGTFLPVKVDDVSEHKMHAEWGEITPKAAAEINDTRARGGRIIPVGTTALRLIETAGEAGGTLGGTLGGTVGGTERGTVAPWVGETDIFITPGYRFKVADALMTNFHLPMSTLMMLVAALMGQARIMEIYAHAIEERYRFFSYGDASLLLPGALHRAEAQ